VRESVAVVAELQDRRRTNTAPEVCTGYCRWSNRNTTDDTIATTSAEIRKLHIAARTAERLLTAGRVAAGWLPACLAAFSSLEPLAALSLALPVALCTVPFVAQWRASSKTLP
jgi:hypothetical protein